MNYMSTAGYVPWQDGGMGFLRGLFGELTSGGIPGTRGVAGLAIG
jgi:hypothetical protein